MPWYTAGKDEPMEVALRYQITMKKLSDDASDCKFEKQRYKLFIIHLAEIFIITILCT